MSYTILLYPFMLKLGPVYYCFNHSSNWSQSSRMINDHNHNDNVNNNITNSSNDTIWL